MSGKIYDKGGNELECRIVMHQMDPEASLIPENNYGLVQIGDFFFSRMAVLYMINRILAGERIFHLSGYILAEDPAQGIPTKKSLFEVSLPLNVRDTLFLGGIEISWSEFVKFVGWFMANGAWAAKEAPSVHSHAHVRSLVLRGLEINDFVALLNNLYK
jgi:hypothetical protein